MAPIAQRRLNDIDDEDEDGPYDPKYPGQKIIADGGRVVSRAFLQDGMFPLMDSFAHRPHEVRATDSQALRDAEAEAERAYHERTRWLENSWRGRNNPPPRPLKDGESERDRYIDDLTNAWRWKPPSTSLPPGSAFLAPPSADADTDFGSTINRATTRRESLGARPGEEGDDVEAARRRRGSAMPRGAYFQSATAAARSTGDAKLADAEADRERAYREYLDRLANGWKT